MARPGAGGFFCVNVENADADLEGLVKRRLLDRPAQHDREAITAALNQFFDRSLAVSAGHA